MNESGQLYAWGLNNHGQLGIGYKGESTHLPTLVQWDEADKDQKVANVDGGEHHTICLTEEGRVYVWGRNDEGQCGVGDLFGNH